MPGPHATTLDERQRAFLAAPRTVKIVEMYRQGLTLEKIGSQFGLSRERVRQLLWRAGITRDEGGAAVSKHMKGDARVTEQIRRDARYHAKHGLTFAAYLAVPKQLKAAFSSHRSSAKARGIPFLLTLSQWLAVWENSGKLAERGQGRGKFCMSRIKDDGGYEVGNVHIQLATENGAEAAAKWRGKKKANPGVFLIYPGLKRPYLVKHRGQSIGFFATEDEAIAAKRAATVADPPSKYGFGGGKPGRGKGWTFLGRRKTPYQMRFFKTVRYFATQAEAEAEYQRLTAEFFATTPTEKVAHG